MAAASAVATSGSDWAIALPCNGKKADARYALSEEAWKAFTRSASDWASPQATLAGSTAHRVPACADAEAASARKIAQLQGQIAEKANVFKNAQAMKVREIEAEDQEIVEATQRLLLSDYAPASVVVTAEFETLYMHGAVGDFLEFPAGAPTTNLLTLARRGLRNKLRTAVKTVLGDGIPLVNEQARMLRDQQYRQIEIVARHLLQPKELERMVCCPGPEFTPAPAKNDIASVKGKVVSVKFRGRTPRIH